MKGVDERTAGGMEEGAAAHRVVSGSGRSLSGTRRRSEGRGRAAKGKSKRKMEKRKKKITYRWVPPVINKEEAKM